MSFRREVAGAGAAAGVGCFMVIFFLALSIGISCAMGWAASWVLGYFGIHVPWYVCSVAMFLLGAILRRGGSGK